MPCVQVGSAIVCMRGGEWSRRVAYCPTCKRRRRMVELYEKWYGWDRTCCACGDSWQDGERAPRPFKRGWRKEAIARARRRWDEIGAERAA